MAKLHQHQLDETYYTKRNIGYFVTHQIHPDGVAYLKYCGVRLGDEIPPYCMSQLEAYGWLFTKDEVPYGGAVDWSPRWATIRPRPLSELKVFRQVPSVTEWSATGADSPYRSAADQLEAELREMREKSARKRDEKMQRLIADIDAKQRATREARLKRTSSVKTTGAAPAAATSGSASTRNSPGKSTTKTRTVAGAEGKTASQLSRQATVNPAGKVRPPRGIAGDQPRPSTSASSLSAMTVRMKPDPGTSADSVPYPQAHMAFESKPVASTSRMDNRAETALISSSPTAAAVVDASSRPSWMVSVHTDVADALNRESWWAKLGSNAGWAFPLAFGVLMLVGVIGPFAQWAAAILVGLMLIGRMSALSGHLMRAVLNDVNRVPWGERKAKLLLNPEFQRDRGVLAILLLLLSVFVVSLTWRTDAAWFGFLMTIPLVWAIREVWRAATA